MKVLAQFNLNCGRMGDLDGLFIADSDAIRDAYGTEVYFGEVLGKHSEITCELDPSQITIKSEDQDFIAKLESVIGSQTISGFNPFDYIETD